MRTIAVCDQNIPVLDRKVAVKDGNIAIRDRNVEVGDRNEGVTIDNIWDVQGKLKVRKLTFSCDVSKESTLNVVIKTTWKTQGGRLLGENRRVFIG
jgi:hypothetical protein